MLHISYGLIERLSERILCMGWELRSVHLGLYN